ncbi:hypothetical protein ACOMHN_003604 [Nucella lapillus]
MDTSTDSGQAVSDISTSPHLTHTAIFAEDQAAIIIWKYCFPAIIVLGAFGNLATVLVMRRFKEGNGSLHLLLTALAVSDFLILSVAGGENWLTFGLEVKVRNVHSSVCKLQSWILYSLGSLSPWLLTCVTVQRMMAVRWPHRVRMMCSRRRTCIAIGVTTIVSCALHVYCLFTFDISEDNICTYQSLQPEIFLARIYGWVDLCVSTVLPFICLLVCDVILSLTLFQGASVQCVAVYTTFSHVTNSDVTNSHVTSSHMTSSHVTNIRRRLASRTTVLRLALSCAFMLLTLPVCLHAAHLARLPSCCSPCPSAFMLLTLPVCLHAAHLARLPSCCSPCPSAFMLLTLPVCLHAAHLARLPSCCSPCPSAFMLLTLPVCLHAAHLARLPSCCSPCPSAFMLLTLPVCVFFLWNSYMSQQLKTSPELVAQSHLAFAVTSLLWYTNSAINFLLYCFTGTQFRKEFLSLIRCGK